MICCVTLPKNILILTHLHVVNISNNWTACAGSDSGVERVGVEGKDVRLECSGSGGGRCSWRTPYERTYALNQGEYAERGRIQAGTAGAVDGQFSHFCACIHNYTVCIVSESL